MLNSENTNLDCDIMIIWDGTYIEGTLTHIQKLNNFNYGIISEYNADCFYIKRKNLLPVIIDEMKYIFGIKKIGTRYNNKYIFYSPYKVEGIWYEEIRLSDVKDKLNYAQLREVRKILAFRYVLGLTSINETSIIRRNSDLYDFNDYNIHNYEEKISLSMRILEKWFNEININKTIFLMIKRDNLSNKLANILYIRTEITKTICNFDKKHLDLVSRICDRLLNAIDNVDKQT